MAQRLAVFDLDGTITRYDTFVPYVIGFLGRRPWRLLRLAAFLPALLKFALGGSDRGALKAALMKSALGGRSRAELEAWTQAYVPKVLAHEVFDSALRAIDRHREAGDTLVLMSASPDLYVPVIARRLGFHEVSCTGVQWNGDRLDGALTTPNCRGAEKARRFEELRRRHGDLPTIAYGNAHSDLEHLRLARQAVVVNPDASLERAAKAAGMQCVRWN